MTLALPSLTKVEIDSIDVTTYVSSWKVEREFGEAVSKSVVILKENVSATGLLFDEDNAFHTIEIWRGVTTTTDTKIFKGEVGSFRKDGKNVILNCVDELNKGKRSEVTKSFDINIDTEAGVISDIFSTLVTDYAELNADATTIQDSGTTNTLVKFVCNHADVYERWEKLQDLLDWQFYYNPIDDKVYFEPKGTPSNSNVLTVGTNVITKPVWVYDKSKMCNKLTILGAEEIVETTESGQIGVTTGYSQTSIALNNTPFSVKVFADAANPPTTLRKGGNESVTTYDYSVDVENKLVVWNTAQYTPGAADFVEIRYGHRVPRPVLARNQSSIDTHGVHQKAFFKSELKDVADVEEFAKKYVQKYGTPFIASTIKAINISDVYSGETIRVIDTVQNIDKELLVNKVTMVYPYKFDSLVVGDKKLRVAPWGSKTMDRIRRLEEELGKSQDILVQIIDFSRSTKYKRRYMKLQKKTYPDSATDLMIWGSASFGIWGTNKWGDTVSAFLLGSGLYGVLGINKLGDSTGTSYSDVKITQGNNRYLELFYDNTFEDTVVTTANWDTVGEEISFTAGQLAQTSSIYLGDTDLVTKATLTVTVTGTLTLEMSADGGGNWETVTSGVEHTFANTGSDLRIKITESGAAGASVTAMQCNYFFV